MWERSAQPLDRMGRERRPKRRYVDMWIRDDMNAAGVEEEEQNLLWRPPTV